MSTFRGSIRMAAATAAQMAQRVIAGGEPVETGEPKAPPRCLTATELRRHSFEHGVVGFDTPTLEPEVDEIPKQFVPPRRRQSAVLRTAPWRGSHRKQMMMQPGQPGGAAGGVEPGEPGEANPAARELPHFTPSNIAVVARVLTCCANGTMQSQLDSWVRGRVFNGTNSPHNPDD